VRSRLVVAVALAAAGAAPVHAQESPAQVAAAFFKAVAEERWRDAARQLDLAAFDRFRRERIAAARLPQPPHRQTTVEDLLRHDPDMPRAVAEYQIRKMTEARRHVFNWVDHEFAGVADVDALAALSAEESAARWLQARDLRWQSRRAAERERARGCALPPGQTPRCRRRCTTSLPRQSPTPRRRTFSTGTRHTGVPSLTPTRLCTRTDLV
jgi:hypothetical protein